LPRLAVTVLLGAVAAGLAIWWLGRAYDVDASRLLGFLASSALFVVAFIGLAAVAALALGWLRGRRYRSSSGTGARSVKKRPKRGL
jgi:apolipoprotein N-acyltransferase